MNRALIALAVVTATFAAPSFAQTTMIAASSVVAQPGDLMLADHTMRASKLIGSTVYNDASEKVGQVDDVVVTAGAIEPTVIVLISGGFLSGADKLTTEPLSHLKLAPGNKMMMAGATKDALMARPAFRYTNTWINGGGG